MTIGCDFMVRVLIGTTNQIKIDGAKEAFQEYFDNVEIKGITVSSEVNNQPINEEIFLGAKNRVQNLIKYADENNVTVDFFLGIESGITNVLGKWMNVSISVIKDKNGYQSFGTSASYPIPDKYISEIQKTDLGKVMKKLFKEENITNQKGGIDYLTHDKISRKDLTKEAFLMALTSFINNDIWKDE